MAVCGDISDCVFCYCIFNFIDGMEGCKSKPGGGDEKRIKTNPDVSKNTLLEALSCGYNKLTELDVSNNTALEWLSCVGNQLTNLDVSKNTVLKNFFCYDNELTDIDVSNNTDLSWFIPDSRQTLLVH